VLTSSKQVGGRTVVVGVIPGDFRSAVAFFVQKLPVSGYRNLSGDAEMDEAEPSSRATACAASGR
jgi:hypothetical protein